MLMSTGSPWFSTIFNVGNSLAISPNTVRAMSLSLMTLGFASNPLIQLRGARGGEAIHLARPLPGEDDSVDYRDGRKHGDHPEHRRHHIEQGADDHQHQTQIGRA